MIVLVGGSSSLVKVHTWTSMVFELRYSSRESARFFGPGPKTEDRALTVGEPTGSRSRFFAASRPTRYLSTCSPRATRRMSAAKPARGGRVNRSYELAVTGGETVTPDRYSRAARRRSKLWPKGGGNQLSYSGHDAARVRHVPPSRSITHQDWTRVCFRVDRHGGGSA